jgi:hypothetical protein
MGLAAGTAVAVDSLQFKIWQQTEVSAIYLKGVRDGLIVGHDLLLNQHPGDKIFYALGGLLALEPEEFRRIATSRGEPITEGRYYGAAADLIRDSYGR